MENRVVNCKCKNRGNFLELKLTTSQEDLFNPQNNHIYGFFCYPDEPTSFDPNNSLYAPCQKYELKNCFKVCKLNSNQ